MNFNIFVFSPMYHNQWHETLMYHKAIYKEGLKEEAGQLRDLTGHSFADMPTLNKLEKRYIQFVLNKTNGKMGGSGGASEILGINRTTLYARMKKLGMRGNG